MHNFDRAITLRHDGDHFGADLSRDWWVGDAGPWGGYTSALFARAISESVPELPLISMTVHFARRLDARAADITVEVEARGSRLAQVSARILQDGQVGAFAVATLGANRQDDFVTDFPMPDVAVAEHVRRRNESQHPYMQHFDIRPTTIVRPWSGENEGTLAGWIGMVQTRALDVPLLSALPDVWMPGTWARLTQPAGKVTVNMTVNFRSAITRDDTGPWFIRVRTRHIERGFNDEEAELWGADGRLLVRSHQMVLMARRKGTSPSDESPLTSGGAD